jgi:hypothetical protein
VTALTTEPVGEGTRGWATWREYGRLLARISTRTADDLRLFAYTIRRHDQVVEVTARRDSRDTTLMPHAAMLGPDDRATTAVPFRQVAPSEFLASLTVDPRANVRLVAEARGADAAAAGLQPTRLVSSAADDVAPERQVDPEHALDLQALSLATGGTYTDPATLAAGRPAGPAAAGAGTPDRASLAVFRLWPLLLVLGLLLYLAEIAYRRWPRGSSRVTA